VSPTHALTFSAYVLVFSFLFYFNHTTLNYSTNFVAGANVLKKFSIIFRNRLTSPNLVRILVRAMMGTYGKIMKYENEVAFVMKLMKSR
jgi:hypothetical protein